MSWRTGSLFAAGLLVGAAVGGWAVIQARNQAVWQDNDPTHAMGNAPAQAAAASDAASAQAQPVAAAAPAVAPAAAAQQCEGNPIVARGPEDGKETLQSAPRTAGKSEVSSLLLTGKEAAASGRNRDAEIAFLNACRNAQAVSGEDAPVALADALYQLGRHYANVAQAKGAAKSELLQRSQALLQAATQTYLARYGASHEKTRFANQALATAQRLAGGATLVPPLADAKPNAAPAPAPAAAKQAVAKAPAAATAPAAPPAPTVHAKAAPAAPAAPAIQATPAPAAPAVPGARSEPKAKPAPATAAADREEDRNDRGSRRRAEQAAREEARQSARAAEAARAPSPPPVVAEPAPEPTRRPRVAETAPDSTPRTRVAEPTREPSPPPRVAAPAREEPRTAREEARTPREEPHTEARVAQPAPEAPVRSVRRPRFEEPREAPAVVTEPPPPPPGTAMGAPTAEGSVGDVP